MFSSNKKVPHQPRSRRTKVFHVPPIFIEPFRIARGIAQLLSPHNCLDIFERPVDPLVEDMAIGAFIEYGKVTVRRRNLAIKLKLPIH